MVDQDYGRFDLWRDSVAADRARAHELAALLELRAQQPDQIAARTAYRDLLGIGPGSWILDVGCGSGVVTRDAARRVRPGGRVAIFDLDGDGVILAHPDRLLTRRIVAASADHLIVNGWLARQLPARLAAAGLQAIGVRAFTSVECDPAGFYARLAERRASVAAQAGVISADEHQGWIDALHAEQAAGRFLGGQTHLFVWGTRPE